MSKPVTGRITRAEGVSELVEIRASMKLLEAREKELCTMFKDLGQGVYTDGPHTVAVTESSRTSVDLPSMRYAYSDLVKQFEVTSTFLKVVVLN